MGAHPHFGEGCSVPGAAQSIVLTSFLAPQPFPLGVSLAGLRWAGLYILHVRSC